VNVLVGWQFRFKNPTGYYLLDLSKDAEHTLAHTLQARGLFGILFRVSRSVEGLEFDDLLRVSRSVEGLEFDDLYGFY
jgi:hypothetical protein